MYESSTSMTRAFRLDNQPCLLHIPEKPNGYLVLYLGDSGHYVEDNQAFWLEHPERSKFIHYLLDQGYTLFTSHLYGNDWGSKKSVHLLNQLYEHVRRQVTVNPYIHVVAEGMGALTALHWQEKHNMAFRSMTFFTPCLSLKALYEQEQMNQLYFKRFKKELAQSYEIDENHIDQEIIKDYQMPKTSSPVLIFHDVANPYYTVHNHSRRFEEQQQEAEHTVELKLAIQPILPRVTSTVLQFLRSYESTLENPY